MELSSCRSPLWSGLTSTASHTNWWKDSTRAMSFRRYEIILPTRYNDSTPAQQANLGVAPSRQRPSDRVNQFIEFVLNCLDLCLSRRVGNALAQYIHSRIHSRAVNRSI